MIWILLVALGIPLCVIVGTEIRLTAGADVRDTMVGPFIAAAAPSSRSDH